MRSLWQVHFLFLAYLGFVTGLSPVLTNYLVSGCGSIVLECPPGSLMTVVQAGYSTGGNCDGENTAQLNDRWEVWRSVVTRCNGYTSGNCSYNLNVEIPESVLWDHGRIDVKYRCERQIYHSCGGKIESDHSGYLSSPGYPKYYLGGRECVWNVYADPGQSIHIKIMDLSLQVGDCLIVKEVGDNRLEHCGTIQSTITWTSSSSQVEIRLKTSGRMVATSQSTQQNQLTIPQRGVLISYRPIGCSTPVNLTKDQFSVINSTHARFNCRKPYLFQARYLTVNKIVECRNGEWLLDDENCLMNENKLLSEALHHLHQTYTHESGGGGIGFELGAVIIVGILLVISMVIAILLYFKFKYTEEIYLQDDMINLKEDMSKQNLFEELERF